MLLLYIGAGGHKGALVEVGAALGADVPVFVVGVPPGQEEMIGSWLHHPRVRQFESMAHALAAIQAEHTLPVVKIYS